MAHSRSLAGPWVLESNDAPVLYGRPGRWDAASTNPAPHILSNGTALLVYRGLNGLATDRIGAAMSTRAGLDGWRGPYTRVSDEPLFGRCGNWTNARADPNAPADTGCSPVHNWTKEIGRSGQNWDRVCDECVGWAEDPFLFSTPRGYHLLTHNLRGKGGRSTDPVAWWVGYAFSPDFVHWRYAETPVATNTFTTTDGATVTLGGRERPQLLLDSSGTPLALFSGAVPGPGAPPGYTGTFTMVQPTTAAVSQQHER